MIRVEELLNEFELKMNTLGRQDNQNIFLEHQIVYLNNAQITWVKSKLNQNNIYKIGYEGMRKRIDDLQVLKVNNRKLPSKRGSNIKYIDYISDMKDLENYMFYVSSYGLATTKDKCKDTVTINLIKEGELDSLYYNENYTPSFFWREALATIGDDKLYVYTSDEFSISEVYVTYLRYPKRIDIEGYIHIDGSNSIHQDCELPEYAKNDIVDIAVKHAAQSTDNTAKAQFAKEREFNNE